MALSGNRWKLVFVLVTAVLAFSGLALPADAQLMPIPEERPLEIELMPKARPEVPPPPAEKVMEEPSAVKPKPPTRPKVTVIEEKPAQPKPAFSGGLLPGFLFSDTPFLYGQISSSDTEKTLLEKDDIAYIDIGEKAGARVGNVMFAYQVGAEVIHPATGRVIGLKVKVLGEMKVLAVAPDFSQVQITDSPHPVPVGAPVRRGKIQLSSLFARPGDSATTGYIIAPLEDIILISQYDMVFLDLGVDNKLEPGQVFEVYKGLAGRTYARLLIVAVQCHRISLAMVLDNSDAIYAGAWVRGSSP